MPEPKQEPKTVELREPTPMDELTVKQRLYVRSRLDGLAPSAAYRAAGYSEGGVNVNPYRMEQNPKIREAIKWAIGRGNDEEIDRDAVLKGLMDAVASAATSAELTMAWREIGKLTGVYAPERSELLIQDMTTEKLKTLSDKQLLGLVDKGSQAPNELNDVIDAQFEVLQQAIEAPQEVDRDGGESRKDEGR